MPVFMGFRANRGFWFAEHDEPYTIELPRALSLATRALGALPRWLRDPLVRQLSD